ncbi:DUF2199 domain-containing protein [Streptomyces sp. NPDC002308]
MTSDPGFTCSRCGRPNCSTNAPYVWEPSFADSADCLLSSDQCVIQAQHYFVKGLVEIPVIGSDEVLSWAMGLPQPGQLLTVEQRAGITMERVRAIAEAVLHPTDDESK